MSYRSVEWEISQEVGNLVVKGSNPELVLVSYKDYIQLVSELGAKITFVQINKDKDPTAESFEGARIGVGGSVINVLPDLNTTDTQLKIFGTNRKLNQFDDSYWITTLNRLL